MAMNIITTRLGAVYALKQQVARHSPTPETAAAQMARLRRIALLVGRPVPPRPKAKD